MNSFNYSYFKYYSITLVVLFLSSVRTDGHFHTTVCFAEYSQQTNNITHTYWESYKSCDDKDNINRWPTEEIDVEVERQKLQDLTQKTCSNLNTCNLINEADDFFECHSKASFTNVNNSVIINMRATAISIELNDQYSEEHRELLRCHLAAKRLYLHNLIEAYNQHLICLAGNP